MGPECERHGGGPVMAAVCPQGSVPGSAGTEETVRAWRRALQPLCLVDAIQIDDILMIGI